MEENNGEFVSAIGNESVAERLTHWTGVYIPLSKQPVYLDVGDEALAVRLKRSRKYYMRIPPEDIKPSDFDYYIIYRDE